MDIRGAVLLPSQTLADAAPDPTHLSEEAYRHLAFIYFTCADADAVWSNEETITLLEFLERRVGNLSRERSQALFQDAFQEVNAIEGNEARLCIIEQRAPGLFGHLPRAAREALLDDLIQLSRVDGHVSEHETELCERVGSVLCLRPPRTGEPRAASLVGDGSESTAFVTFERLVHVFEAIKGKEDADRAADEVPALIESLLACESTGIGWDGDALAARPRAERSWVALAPLAESLLSRIDQLTSRDCLGSESLRGSLQSHERIKTLSLACYLLRRLDLDKQLHDFLGSIHGPELAEQAVEQVQRIVDAIDSADILRVRASLEDSTAEESIDNLFADERFVVNEAVHELITGLFDRDFYGCDALWDVLTAWRGFQYAAEVSSVAFKGFDPLRSASHPLRLWCAGVCLSCYHVVREHGDCCLGCGVRRLDEATCAALERLKAVLETIRSPGDADRVAEEISRLFKQMLSRASSEQRGETSASPESSLVRPHPNQLVESILTLIEALGEHGYHGSTRLQRAIRLQYRANAWPDLGSRERALSARRAACRRLKGHIEVINSRTLAERAVGAVRREYALFELYGDMLKDMDPDGFYVRFEGRTGGEYQALIGEIRQILQELGAADHYGCDELRAVIAGGPDFAAPVERPPVPVIVAPLRILGGSLQESLMDDEPETAFATFERLARTLEAIQVKEDGDRAADGVSCLIGTLLAFGSKESASTDGTVAARPGTEPSWVELAPLARVLLTKLAELSSREFFGSESLRGSLQSQQRIAAVSIVCHMIRLIDDFTRLQGCLAAIQDEELAERAVDQLRSIAKSIESTEKLGIAVELTDASARRAVDGLFEATMGALFGALCEVVTRLFGQDFYGCDALWAALTALDGFTDLARICPVALTGLDPLRSASHPLRLLRVRICLHCYHTLPERDIPCLGCGARCFDRERCVALEQLKAVLEPIKGLEGADRAADMVSRLLKRILARGSAEEPGEASGSAEPVTVEAHMHGLVGSILAVVEELTEHEFHGSARLQRAIRLQYRANAWPDLESPERVLIARRVVYRRIKEQIEAVDSEQFAERTVGTARHACYILALYDHILEELDPDGYRVRFDEMVDGKHKALIAEIRQLLQKLDGAAYYGCAELRAVLSMRPEFVALLEGPPVPETVERSRPQIDPAPLCGYSLHIKVAGYPDETRYFSTPRVRIGRRTDVNTLDDQADEITLRDKNVSGVHGEFTWDGNTLMYTDRSSTNGSHTLQGQRIANVELVSGMALRLGDSLITVQYVSPRSSGGRGRTMIAGPGMIAKPPLTMMTPLPDRGQGAAAMAEARDEPERVKSGPRTFVRAPHASRVIVGFYAHSDESIVAAMMTRLRTLAQYQAIELIDERDVAHHDMKAAVQGASIVLLFMSAGFMASHFVHANELAPLLSRAKRRGVLIYSIFVGPCTLKGRPMLAKLPTLTEPGRPLEALGKRALVKECTRIAKLLGTLAPAARPCR